MTNKLLWLLVATILMVSCGETNDPEIENEEEVITDVTLSFYSDSADEVVARALDPDGLGVADLEVLDTIRLKAGITYELSIDLENSLEGESITDEVREESDEHMFFFGFTTDIFSDPAGSGNVSGLQNAINYLDTDVNGLPVGLETKWTAGTAASGTFRVVLKHQPDLKSASSTIADGESDVDVEWVIEIIE